MIISRSWKWSLLDAIKDVTEAEISAQKELPAGGRNFNRIHTQMLASILPSDFAENGEERRMVASLPPPPLPLPPSLPPAPSRSSGPPPFLLPFSFSW